MPRYRYKGYDQDGRQIAGAVTASSRSDAYASLTQKGYLVSRLRSTIFLKQTKKSVSDRSFYQFNQEMIALIRAGIPLVEALDMCCPRTDSGIFSAILDTVKARVTSGTIYSDACSEFPEAFDSVYIATVKTGEHTGELKEALIQYHKYLGRKQKVAGEIKQAAYYPLFLLGALVVVVSILFIFVVPSFAELYESFGAELPVVTQVIMAIADWTPLFLGSVASLVVVASMVWRSLDKSDALHIGFDRALNRLPLVGPFRYTSQQSRIMRMLSGLLNSGTPLVQALTIVGETFSKSRIGYLIRLVSSQVESGDSFSDSVARQHIFSAQTVKMLTTGENSGSLPEMMDEVSIYLDEILDQRLKKIAALFEPAMMLVLGLLVGVVIIAMYLPIFFLADVVQ